MQDQDGILEHHIIIPKVFYCHMIRISANSLLQGIMKHYEMILPISHLFPPYVSWHRTKMTLYSIILLYQKSSIAIWEGFMPTDCFEILWNFPKLNCLFTTFSHHMWADAGPRWHFRASYYYTKSLLLPYEKDFCQLIVPRYCETFQNKKYAYFHLFPPYVSLCRTKMTF